ncbi:MAG: GGDEF domain-containing protein [Bacilli bacterium]
MKKKIIIIISILIILLGGLTIFILIKPDKDTTLTLLEKKWIDNNKNNVIDFEVANNIPIFSTDGEGIIFDFLGDLEQATGLEFNKISVDQDANYGFHVKNKKDLKDILVEQDNYVILMAKKEKFTNLNEIKNLTIGVLNDDLTNINKYLNSTENNSYKTFSNSDDLIKQLENGEVNAIIMKKISNLDQIIKNKNLNIVYNITEYTNDFVISIGEDKRLNNIIYKYYQKWSKEKYEKSYNKYFADNYFKYAGIDEKDINSFKSKRYNYGFIENGMYDSTINSVLVGLNNKIIENFIAIAGVEINYKKFKSIEQMTNEFNDNDLDFVFNDFDKTSYKMDVLNTTSIYDEDMIICSPLDKNIIINSINSLESEKVLVIKNSKIGAYLIEHNIKVKQYDNLKALMADSGSDIIAIDKESYNYYLAKELNKYKIDLSLKLPSQYTFLVRDIKANKVFGNFFDFYLSYVPEKQIINEAYQTTLQAKNSSMQIVKIIIYSVTGLLIIFIAITAYKIIFKKPKKAITINKDSKIKYIDLLTSLKNRNYLNDHIETWDNSEIYPQAIIIIDLNSIAYINDNYGHNEGDEVIREAANILIRNQIDNSEIIRTNGNEFLMYLVDYNEKDVINFIRKLNKEFKDLAHGFGAAIGYSVINDRIKTIDDAINEATQDMRNIKEESNN